MHCFVKSGLKGRGAAAHGIFFDATRLTKSKLEQVNETANERKVNGQEHYRSLGGRDQFVLKGDCLSPKRANKKCETNAGT